MTPRPVTQLVRALEVTEGAGVNVHRTIGTPARRHLDPFLLLDHFSSDDPDDYSAGFPEHPHRGFNTFTYMLDGHMRHGDSMGNRGDLGPGGAQWMKAASGVIHSEMPQQIDGLMRGFQLWINLPASAKMSDPEYQEIRPEGIPEIQSPGSRIRLLAGSLGDRQGPVRDLHTDPLILDLSLEAGASQTFDLPIGHTAFVHVFEGSAVIAGTQVPQQHLAVLGEGEGLEIQADTQGLRALVVAGRPIGEPIVQYGPFVMNQRAEIEQAMADYREGRLVRTRAGFHNL
ncbi:MAG TPA: pirin family protein [Gammaproteobacteria bacterium]|nr:pirin family protein [Gammaproteobacteria bacterium]